MDLEKFQYFQARVYTDAMYRQEFLENPQVAARDLGFSYEEIEAFASEVQRFSRTLLNKRYHEVCSILPITSKLLCCDMRSAFMKFAKNYKPQGVKKHHQDAVQFCQFLMRSTICKKKKSLIRYERNCVAATLRKRYFYLSCFGIPIRSIAKSKNFSKKLERINWFSFSVVVLIKWRLRLWVYHFEYSGE